MQRKVLPSEYIAKSNLKLTSKYIEFYKSSTELRANSNEKNNMEPKEKWSDGSKRKFTKKDLIYYKPFQNFGFINELNESKLLKIPNNDFDRALQLGNATTNFNR